MNALNYFEIQANNPEKAISFYSKVFGWQFTKLSNMSLEYWLIKTGGLHGGLMKRPIPVSKDANGTNAFVSSIQVDDFDEIADLILANGGKIVVAKFAVPNKCWQGYFMDTEGNTFGVYQVDPNAK